jgi:hypothetical protein
MGWSLWEWRELISFGKAVGAHTVVKDLFGMFGGLLEHDLPLKGNHRKALVHETQTNLFVEIARSLANASFDCASHSCTSRSIVGWSAPAFTQGGAMVGATQTASARQMKIEAAAAKLLSGLIISVSVVGQ